VRWLQLAVLYYLRFWARLKLNIIRPDIIGITGSAGKTSCVQAIVAILGDSFRVKVSEKANSESGIPLNILGLTPNDYSVVDWLRLIFLAPIKALTNWEKYDIYLVELGIDSPRIPKNMEYLLTIVQPKVGVFLNALGVHSENFDSLINQVEAEEREAAVRKLIGEEKGKLIQSLPEDGVAVLNADDVNVMAFSAKTKANVTTFGFSKKSTVRVIGYKVVISGTQFRFSYADQAIEAQFPTMALPKHYGYTLAAALATGLTYDINFDEGVLRLVKYFRLPKGRMSLLPAINGATILDSSYNASMEPMLDALDLLQVIAPKRKLALLGDMRELGKEAKFAHEVVIKKAIEVGDELYLVGPLIKEFGLSVINKDSNIRRTVRWFANAAEAAEAIKNELRKDDVLMVKGSQNTIFLEYAVEKLMRNPEEAEKLLCRRGEFWKKQRQASGLI